MILNHSLYRAATIACAAGLLSLAHVSPAAAQTTTRHTASCVASAASGESNAECMVHLPVDKRFVIESATVYGSLLSSQRTLVEIRTTRWGGGALVRHFVPAGFQVLSNSRSVWSGALPGTIFSEAIGQYAPGTGSVRLYFWRGGTTEGAEFRMTLSGYLEDM